MVEQRRIIRRRRGRVAFAFLRASTEQQQRRPLRGFLVRVQSHQRPLWLAQAGGRRRKHFQSLLGHCAIGETAPKTLQPSKRLDFATLSERSLRAPENRVLPQYRVALRVGEPGGGFFRAAFLQVAVTQRQRCARAIRVARVTPLKANQPVVVRAGILRAQLSRQRRQLRVRPGSLRRVDSEVACCRDAQQQNYQDFCKHAGRAAGTKITAQTRIESRRHTTACGPCRLSPHLYDAGFSGD